MVGTNLLEPSSSWALNPPKKCPKCGAKVKTFYINLNLDQVVMCESLSCNWPFKGTNGSIIPGKVEEVKQEVGKQVKEELVEVNQNDKEVAVCGNSKEKKKKKREKRGKETFDREYARAGHLVGTLKNKVEKTNKKMEKLGRKKGEFAPLVSGGEQWFDALLDPLKSGEGPMTHSAAHSSGRSVGVRKAEVPAEEADILTNLLSELSGIETSCAQGDVAASAHEYKGMEEMLKDIDSRSASKDGHKDGAVTRKAGAEEEIFDNCPKEADFDQFLDEALDGFDPESFLNSIDIV